MRFFLYILFSASFIAQANGNELNIPAEEMAWIGDRKAFEKPRSVQLVFHNPNVTSATNLTGLEIKSRSSRSGDDYQLIFRSVAGAASLRGDVTIAVDDSFTQTRNYNVQSRSPGDDLAIVEAMKTGTTLSLTLPIDGTSTKISIPLDGFTAALNPQDANLNTTAKSRATSIRNQCVQRNREFNYYCLCLGEEFVTSFPADAAYGPALQTEALESAKTKCETNRDSNPVLSELNVHELMLGAKLSDSVPSDQEGGVTIGDLVPGGPAQSAGLRSGEIITKVGSVAAAQRLLNASPPAQNTQALTVYSPQTETTRIIRVTPRLAPGDAKLRSFPQFELLKTDAKTVEPPLASTPTTARVTAATELEPAPAPAPEIINTSFSDPIGEDCANDQLLSDLYDCACIDAKAPAARENLADRQFEQLQNLLPRRRASLEQAEKQLAAATSDIDRQRAQAAVDRTAENVRRHETRPDPAAISLSAVKSQAYQGNSCKKGDYIRDQEYNTCLKSAGRSSSITDPESFCSCSATKLAEIWMASDASYSSRFAVNNATAARNACR